VLESLLLSLSSGPRSRWTSNSRTASGGPRTRLRRGAMPPQVPRGPSCQGSKLPVLLKRYAMLGYKTMELSNASLLSRSHWSSRRCTAAATSRDTVVGSKSPCFSASSARDVWAYEMVAAALSYGLVLSWSSLPSQRWGHEAVDDAQASEPIASTGAACSRTWRSLDSSSFQLEPVAR
jgi:hypothetical protein